MTVASQVKQCLASLKGAEASFSSLLSRTENKEAERIFYDAMMTTSEIIEDLKKRVSELEKEETQYKGF